MLKSKEITAVFLFLLVSAPLHAETEEQTLMSADFPADQTTASAQEDIELLPSMDFRRWPDDGFFETRMSLTDALSSAHADERGAVMLDLAELHLGQMLTVEAQSFIDAAKNNGWMETDRYTALLDAVKLLTSEPVEDIDTSPLIAEDRPDRSLWLSLNSIASGDAVGLSETCKAP